ncbi:MAG: glycosyltransferase, partial [Clostridia bacterium]|nr:glycosyltransferase [Clostridia bacterium]
MNIAMFTNVYKPFIGGVPVSIERLAKGLKELGHNVYVFAPDYPEKETDENNVIRCKLITFYGNDKFDIPVADIFSRDLRAKFLEMDIDIVHVHQPVWMGQRGVRLAELKDIPVAFTYHTHYEEYLHIFKLTKPMFSKGFKRKMRTARDYIIGKDLPSGTKFKRYFKYKILPIYLKYFISTCNGVIFPTDSMREWVGRIGVPSYVLPTGLEES